MQRRHNLEAITSVGPLLLLLGLLISGSLFGYHATPLVTSVLGVGWEAADTAESYAVGHRDVGLWSPEEAEAVIDEAQATKRRLRTVGGLLGALFASGPLALLLGSRHRERRA